MNYSRFLQFQEPPAKKGKKEEPAVEYKTVPCKKYWTVGHCELGPRCVYIHQVGLPVLGLDNRYPVRVEHVYT